MNSMLPISAEREAKTHLAEQLANASGLLGRRLGRIGVAAAAAVFALGAFVPFESGALAPGHAPIERTGS